MHRIETPAYQKAFVQYLRRGVPPTLSLKAAEHPTRYYIWRTRGDGKVRPSHAANNGRIFAWNDPPPTGNPGETYGCRCWAEPYYDPPLTGIDDPPLEPFYPELLIIGLLPAGRLAAAWREWLSIRNISRSWQLNPAKSATKWGNRIEQGNWTPEKISNTIRYGKRYAVKNERTGGPATRYELDKKYVVRDDSTGNILQLSGPNHVAKQF